MLCCTTAEYYYCKIQPEDPSFERREALDGERGENRSLDVSSVDRSRGRGHFTYLLQTKWAFHSSHPIYHEHLSTSPNTQRTSHSHLSIAGPPLLLAAGSCAACSRDTIPSLHLPYSLRY